MSTWDDITNFTGKIAQGAVDGATQGVQGILLRQQLNMLKDRQANLIATFKHEQPQTVAWADSVNQTAATVTAMLQKTSEYVQGIAFSYNSVLQSASMDIPTITAIEKAGLSRQQFLNLDIPAEIGGVPSIIIPGVFATETIEGLINAVSDSFTLQKQVTATSTENQKIEAAINRQRTLLQQVLILKNYLLDVATDAISVYQRTTGLKFDPMPPRASTPEDLTVLNGQLLNMIDRLTALNGNAFMMFRMLINLAESGRIAPSGATEAQLDFLAQRLYALSSIAAIFPSQDVVRTFVANFFQGQMLSILPSFLDFPPVPDAVAPLLKRTPSEKSTFDLNAAQYDPPADFDLNNLP